MSSARPSSSRVFSFSPDFLWGAATSSHQVEGDNRRNDWWQAERDGRLPFASGEACRHWELYPRDLDLARDLGHNAHRFSLEWSRIEPEPGVFDESALEHYAEVVRACRERSLEPLVTLHHFTNPQWFARSGGWLARGAPETFARYAARVAEHIEGVSWWLTINEPTVYSVHGYVLGEWPPFARKAWIRAFRCLKAMARAHLLARRAIKEVHPGARVGYAHSAPWIVPCDASRARDRFAARMRDYVWNRAFLRWIGMRGRGKQETPRERPLDFLGINYYTRTLTRSQGWSSGLVFGRACRDAHHADLGPLGSTGWEVFPQGLTRVLERFGALELPLIVTENGVATEDENLRSDSLAAHLRALARALENGVDVRGYLYWSLMDNFEWSLGTNARFGLAAVDFETQERIPRPAAFELARVCRTNELDSVDLDRSH